MEINNKCQHTIKELCDLVSKPCIAITAKGQYDRNIARNCPGTNLTEIEKEELISFRNNGYDSYSRVK